MMSSWRKWLFVCAYNLSLQEAALRLARVCVKVCV